jgi:formylglycine-generating enzyme required for sulfatase activity
MNQREITVNFFLLIPLLSLVIGNALHLEAQVVPLRATAKQTDRVSRLMSQLRDHDARKAAAEALAEIGTPAVERLIGALRDKDAGVRRLAADVLGRIKDPRSIEPLTAALKDPNDEVQHSAAEALGAQVAPGLTKLNGKDGLSYVWIPPGRFAMGCSALDRECEKDEKPIHRVTITKGFWMSQTAVTQLAYQRVMGNNPSYFKENRSLFRSQNQPVEQVSWSEAKAYCERIEMRLPTEAEWEYAARGGTSESRYGELDSVDSVGWYYDNSAEATIDQGSDASTRTDENTKEMWRQTHLVAQRKPNLYGLYDMLGNVKEWVGDWFGPYPLGAVTDPQGPMGGQFKAVRGASYADQSDRVRVSARESGLQPGYRTSTIGFRCVGN